MPNPMHDSPVGGPVAPDIQALAQLCTGVMPVWARHLATSRAQSEAAVTQMLKAFSDISPHIDRAERQSRQITAALSQSDGGITKLTQACERVLAPVLSDPQLPAGAAAAIEKAFALVRQAVDALDEIAKPFSHETQMVAEQVDRLYMGFQYQDRISQMMALLEGDIVRMQAALEGRGDGALDLAAWLTRLESQYAMREQHLDHHGQQAEGGDNSDEGETTFF